MQWTEVSNSKSSEEPFHSMGRHVTEMLWLAKRGAAGGTPVSVWRIGEWTWASDWVLYWYYFLCGLAGCGASDVRVENLTGNYSELDLIEHYYYTQRKWVNQTTSSKYPERPHKSPNAGAHMSLYDNQKLPVNYDYVPFGKPMHKRLHINRYVPNMYPPKCTSCKWKPYKHCPVMVWVSESPQA